MRKLVLLILCSAMLFGGMYAVLLDLLHASVVFTRLSIGASCVAIIGGYLIWTDFIAPALGVETWEDQAAVRPVVKAPHPIAPAMPKLSTSPRQEEVGATDE